MNLQKIALFFLSLTTLLITNSCDQELAKTNSSDSQELGIKTSAIIVGAKDDREEIETFDNSIASVMAPSGSSTCSATVVGPRHVITAAHCFYEQAKDRFRQNRYIVPAYNFSRGKKPIQKFFIKNLYIPYEYIKLAKGHSGVPQEAFAHDIALIEVHDLQGNTPFADQTQSVPMEAFNERFHMHEDSVTLKAYHGDLKPGTAYKQEGCRFDILYNRGKDIGHTCDNYKGSSGASLQFRGSVVAINTGEFASDHNSGTPISESVLSDLHSIIDENKTAQSSFREIDLEQTPSIGIDVLNNCSEEVLIAFKYKNLAGDWVFDGHYKVAPGELFISPVASRNNVVFYQAQTRNRSLTWEGDHEGLSRTNQRFRMIELDLEDRFYDERIRLNCAQ